MAADWFRAEGNRLAKAGEGRSGEQPRQAIGNRSWLALRAAFKTQSAIWQTTSDKAKRSKKRACLEKIGGGDYSNAKLITRMQINCCPFACLQLGKRINLSFLCASVVPLLFLAASIPLSVSPSIRLRRAHCADDCPRTLLSTAAAVAA